MTLKETQKIQSDLKEMDIGLNDFFLKACQIHGEGTYKMAKNQKRIIEILQKIMEKEEYEARELSRLVGIVRSE